MTERTRPRASAIRLLALHLSLAGSVHMASHRGRGDNHTACDIGRGQWKRTKHLMSYRPFTDITEPNRKAGDGGPPWCSVGDITMSPQFMCPESEAYNWMWVPDDCQLEPIDGPWLRKFAERKHIAFVGDSLMQNMYLSLRCLMHGTMPHMDLFGSFRFGAQINEGVVDLEDVDIPSVFARDGKRVTDYGVIVISVGHHFDEKGVAYQKHGELIVNDTTKEVDFVLTYRMGLTRALKQLEKIGFNKDVVLISWIPHHPMKNGKCVGLDERPELLLDIERVNAMLLGLTQVKRSFKIRLFDLTSMGVNRPDAHPGEKTDGTNDCTHLCTPGLPDVWNRALVHVLRDIAVARRVPFADERILGGAATDEEAEG